MTGQIKKWLFKLLFVYFKDISCESMDVNLSTGAASTSHSSTEASSQTASYNINTVKNK